MDVLTGTSARQSRRSRQRLASALLAAALSAAMGGTDIDGQSGATTLGIPGRTNAHVSLAAEGEFVVAAWAASLPSGVTDVFAAVSRDAGLTFGTPTRVNSHIGDARINGEQPPRVAVRTEGGRSDPGITVLWTSKGASGTTLLLGQSSDLGKSFSRSAVVQGTDAPGNRGWQAIAADREGFLHAMWLDHRELASGDTARPSGGTHNHAGHGTIGTPSAAADATDGVAMAAKSKLYIGMLTETDHGPPAPRPITGGVCYCCKTALAMGRSGSVVAAWRHVYPGNLRDIAFSMSRDGGRTYSEPIRVHEDRWQLNGCPDDGPAMVVDANERIHIVWPTVVLEQGEPVKALFHTSSPDGRGFGTRTRIPTRGFGNHPQVALAARGSLVVAWDELADGSRHVGLARGIVDRSGLISLSRMPLEDGGDPVGVYPAVASAGGNAVVAWTSTADKQSMIRIVRRRM